MLHMLRNILVPFQSFTNLSGSSMRHARDIRSKQKGRLQTARLEKHPATVVDLKDIVKGEFAENAMRKDFLPSEVEAIRRALEPYEKAAAQRRMRMGKAPSGKFPQGLTGQTRDKVGAFAGMSGRTVEKVTAVVKAAEQNPRKFGTLVVEMDRTGRGVPKTAAGAGRVASARHKACRGQISDNRAGPAVQLPPVPRRPCSTRLRCDVAEAVAGPAGC
jgi:hypothetical protein